MVLGFLLFFASCRTVKVFTGETLKISKELHLGFFPSTISESSGLENLGDTLVTFNDSGGEAALFYFSPLSPGEPQKITLDGAINIDWEAIAYDGENLYIGDIGNNFAIRDTLVIYKYSVDKFRNLSLKPSIISFRFIEKGPELCGVRGNPFDCEAMTVINDSLWLFTKNWQDKTSRVYKVPSFPGHYDLHADTVLNPRMLVTGADYYEERNILVLSGYSYYVPRIRAYFLQNGALQDIFMIHFLNHPGLQTEGILMVDGNTIYFSNEKSIKKQGLFKFTIKDY
jgi:hypothetical protein